MSTLQNWFAAAAAEWASSEAELTAIDGETGDGDLGFTVSRGARAIGDALSGHEGDAKSTLRLLAETFAKSNPSSFAALFASGVIAGSNSLPQGDALSKADAAEALRQGCTIIMQRGRSGPGDRTLLDAALPSIEALDACGEDSTLEDRLDAMIVASAEGVERTKSMTPRRGRALWVGDRTQGIPDAGAVAWLRLLEALRGALG